MARANALLTSAAALVVLGVATAPVAVVRELAGGGFALAAEPAAGTTVPDDTYGPGGSKESFSNDQHEVVAETWRDKNGLMRERFEADKDGAQYWGFLQGDDLNTSEWGGTIAIWPLPRPAGRWEMTIYGPGYMILKEYGFLDKADLDREFAHWHRQMRGWVNGFINPAPVGGG
jgi:hypothetical protein